MIGFDESASARIKRRQIEQGHSIDRPPSLLYQEVSTMREFHIAPGEWSRMSRVDKKILYYFRAMEGHYIDIERERGKQEAKAKEVKENLPHIRKKGRS